MEALANRLPPQNEDAEKSVLGALMLDKNAIINVADALEPNDFYQGKHRTIFEAMLDLYAKSEPIDILSLSNRLKEKKRLKDIGDRSYLAELVNSVPTAAHVSHYAEIVHQKAVLRRLIDTSAKITESAFNEQEELAVLIDKAEQSIFNISQRSSRQSFASLKPMLSEAFDRLDTLSKGGDSLRGLATGFLDLDNKLSGLQNSDLIILAARPSLGKSTLALDMARNVALSEKKPVGIFSLEMSKDQLTDRLLCASGNVPLWKFRTGRLHDNDFQNINQAIAKLSDAPIFIDDSSATNIMQIRTMCRRLQSEHGLGLVVIDYLQLMEGSTRTDNRVQEISEISRSLKMLARELDIPILALSQLSRAVEQRGGHPKLSDLRESGCLTGDTLLTSADTGERVPIKNLVGETDIRTFSLENGNITQQIISKVFSSGVKETFLLKTKGGKEIKASANHKFYTRDGWERLDQLKKKIEIATSSTDRELCWDEIVSIRPKGKEEVFDATVPNTHNFLANDIIVHNSIEQDSDIVMFIYREDKEKRDSQRKNIADIIVAKHRNGPTGSLPLYFNEEVVSFKNLEKHHHGTTQETPAPNSGTPEATGSGPESGLEDGLLAAEESELAIPSNN